jgi:glucan 1,3-beta-glucosidase
VIAIELLNEPFPQAPSEVDFLKKFYTSAYDTVRRAAKHPNVVVALDSAFQDLHVWDGFMTEPGWSNVALDTVSYFCTVARLMRVTDT